MHTCACPLFFMCALLTSGEMACASSTSRRSAPARRGSQVRKSVGDSSSRLLKPVEPAFNTDVERGEVAGQQRRPGLGPLRRRAGSSRRREGPPEKGPQHASAPLQVASDADSTGPVPLSVGVLQFSERNSRIRQSRSSHSGLWRRNVAGAREPIHAFPMNGRGDVRFPGRAPRPSP